MTNPGPIADPVAIAARHALDGNFDKAYDAIRQVWIDRVVHDYEPDHDEDEDGPWSSNPETDMKQRAASAMNGAIDADISDALYWMLESELGDEAAGAKANELGAQFATEMQKHIPQVADEAHDTWSDGVAYSRDPYAYHGVSRSDF